MPIDKDVFHNKSARGYILDVRHVINMLLIDCLIG